VYATRNETDDDWTRTSRISGDSFATRGVLALVFRHNGVPQAGVQVRQNGSPIPGFDYYFTDPDIARTTVDPDTVTTGANGTALVIGDSGVAEHHGVGGAPEGYCWPKALGGAIRGVVFVQLKASVPLPSGGTQCP
jgi:hypothetical protein